MFHIQNRQRYFYVLLHVERLFSRNLVSSIVYLAYRTPAVLYPTHVSLFCYACVVKEAPT